jgi:hypothetical protein
MPRPKNDLNPKKNPTAERLRATPFDSVEQLDGEAHAIRLAVWRELTQARATYELLTKPEHAFVLDELKAGLTAVMGNRGKERLYRIFSEGVGLTLELNKDFTKALGDREAGFMEGVVRAGIEGYGRLYMQVKRMIATSGHETDGHEMPPVP